MTETLTFFRATWPSVDFISNEELFFHHTGASYYDASEEQLLISAGARVFLDSYFNALSVAKYRRYTSVSNVTFIATVSGRAIVRVRHVSANNVAFVVAEKKTTGNRTQIELPIPHWEDMQDGLLFLEVQAIDECKLHWHEIRTESPEVHDVCVCIAITHFNRKSHVLPTIRRIQDFMQVSPEHKFELIVVDNSQNITSEEANGAHVVPNKNLGGAGGFARAILEGRKNGHITHMLFMDDDASCSAESLRRTYDILRLAKIDNLAIVGAMLLEESPHIQHEAGAVFDEYCRPLHHNVDVSKAAAVLAMEAPNRVHYGAWWYFAFPLDGAGLPFPFFVRGDDVDFGLRHEFRSVTVNGIASIQPAFNEKDGPVTRYLDTRHQLTHYMNGHLPIHYRKIFRICVRSFWYAALTFRYETATAGVRAMQDILTGPSSFANEPDAASARNDLRSITSREVHANVELETMVLEHIGLRHTPGRRFLSIVTLCGHLLPNMVLRSPVLVQQDYDNVDSVFGYTKVLYTLRLGRGYVAEIDRSQGLKIIFLGFATSLKLLFSARSLSKRFKSEYSNLVSDKFWNGALNLDHCSDEIT